MKHVCMEQLYSPSLIRLWRTGCLELLHTAEEDEDFDVIKFDVIKNLN